MNKRMTIFNYVLLIISILIFGEYLINFAQLSSSYILFLLFFILLALHVYVCGLICDEKKIYKRNVYIYITLYLILLISLMIFITRPNFTLFDVKYLSLYLSEVNLIPFKSILHFLIDEMNLGVRLYNLLGNAIALMPLSFLLILLDKKYETYKSQLKVLFITVLGIELFQFLLSAGRLDIDDFILNIGGAILFFTIIKKLNLIKFFRELFNKDLNISDMTKNVLLIAISLAIIVMDVLFIIELNRYDEYKPLKNVLIAIENEYCESVNNVVVEEYNLHFDCVDVYLEERENSHYSLEVAIKEGMIDITDMSEYFQVINTQEDVKIYQNEDLTIFSCNNSKDLYIWYGVRDYNGECL